jgi:DNA-binding response OmpR family regulator
MSEQIKVVEVDASTGQQVERFLEGEELDAFLADRQAMADAQAAEEAAKAAKEAEKAAILERLGLTADELKVVLS